MTDFCKSRLDEELQGLPEARRRELLHALGVAFDAVVPDVDEVTEGDPADVVVENARRKARADLFNSHIYREVACCYERLAADSDQRNSCSASTRSRTPIR